MPLTPQQKAKIARAKLAAQENQPKPRGFLDKPVPQFAIGAGERALELSQLPFDIASLLALQDRAAVIGNVPAPTPGTTIAPPDLAARLGLSAFTPSAGSLASAAPPSTTVVTGVGPEQGGEALLKQALDLLPKTAREGGRLFTDIATLYAPFKAAATYKLAQKAAEAKTVSQALKLQTLAKQAVEKSRYDARVSPLDFMKIEERAAAPFEQFYDEAVQGQRLVLPPVDKPSIVETGRSVVRGTIGGIRAILGEAQERILTPAGKIAAKTISTADSDAHVIAGKSFEKWRFGIKPAEPVAPGKTLPRVRPEDLDIAAGEVDNLGNVLQGQSPPLNGRVAAVAQNSRAVLNDIFALARKSGVRVSGFLENYLPRFIKPDILDEVYGDVRGMVKNIQQVAEQRGLNAKSSEVLARIAGEKLRDFSVFKNPRTRAFIEHLQAEARATGKPVTIGSLLIRAEKLTQKELTGIFGNLERGRKLAFPMDFYISDPREAIARYIERASKRIAEVRNFGIDDEKLLSLLDDVGKTDPVERAYIEGIIRDYTGISAREALQVKGISRKALTEAQELFVGSEFIAKIALGFATVKQLGQSLISTTVATGYKNFFDGVAKLVRQPQMRRMVRESGILDADIYRAETNVIGRSWIRRVGEKVGYPFMMANRLNFYLAGAAFNKQIDEWLRLAKNPIAKEADVKIAREALEGVGIDWAAKTVNRDEVLRAMFRFANDTQLMRNVLRDPRWLNNPNLRSFALFQRFKLGQFNLTKDIIRQEFKKNTMAGLGASLRWAIGAGIAGTFNVWAVKQLEQLMAGKPVYDDGDTNWQKFVNAISESGGAGWFTDIVPELLAGRHRLSGFGRAVGFQAAPVPVSEALRFGEETMRIYRDIEAQRHFGDVLQRHLGRAAPQIGPLSNVLFDDAFMTGEQIKDRREREKRMVLERYFDVVKENPQTASELVKIFNTRNPEHPLRTVDFMNFLKAERQKPVRRFKANLDLPNALR